MTHPTHVTRDGDSFRVSCEKGCDLGTSALADTVTAANNRADLHEFAQSFLPTLEN